ncbi:MAG: hypothetical protein ACTSXA_11955 [Candidatus Heimdallarchaeota archaeon]
MKVDVDVVREKVAETVPIFKERVLSDEVIEVKKAIIEHYFGKLTYLTEVYDFLMDIFLSGEEPVSFYAADAMINFDSKKEEIKDLFFETIRDSTNEFKRFTAMALLGRRMYKLYPEEIKRIAKKIVREGKTPREKHIAWNSFSACVRKDEIDIEREKIKKEILYTAFFDTLSKFRPDVPVALTRIIEVSLELAVEKAKEVFQRANTKQFEYPQEHYIEIIKDILNEKSLIGEYLALEQVFIRFSDKENPIMKPIALSKEYLCNNCGYQIGKEDNECKNCKKQISKCNVCKLPISFGEETGECKHCHSKSHLSHLHEWIKIKGKCPTCQKKLTVDNL